MPTHRGINRWIRAIAVAVFAISSVTLPAAQAGMIGTQSLTQQQELLPQRHRLDALLAHEEVREQLVAWGVDPADARARAAQLSPAELQRMAAQMEELPAGGDIIGAVVFVFLVLLVTDILGFTDIFPFVKKTVR